MIKKVLETGGDLAVAYSPEMQPGKFFPQMICGAGPVRVLNKAENGESNILVFGNKRIKFHKYIQEIPYLIGEGEILGINREMPKKTEEDLLTQIRDMLITWIFTNFDDSRRPIQFFKQILDLEPLCNFVAYYFVPDMEKKQKLLEENELELKAQVIWQVLKDNEISGGKGPSGQPLIFPGVTQGSDPDDEGPLN